MQKKTTSSDTEVNENRIGKCLDDVTEEFESSDMEIEGKPEEGDEDLFDLVCDRVTRKCFYVKKEEDSYVLPKIVIKRSNSTSKSQDHEEKKTKLNTN